MVRPLIQPTQLPQPQTTAALLMADPLVATTQAALRCVLLQSGSPSELWQVQQSMEQRCSSSLADIRSARLAIKGQAARPLPPEVRALVKLPTLWLVHGAATVPDSVEEIRGRVIAAILSGAAGRTSVRLSWLRIAWDGIDVVQRRALYSWRRARLGLQPMPVYDEPNYPCLFHIVHFLLSSADWHLWISW